MFKAAAIPANFSPRFYRNCGGVPTFQRSASDARWMTLGRSMKGAFITAQAKGNSGRRVAVFGEAAAGQKTHPATAQQG